MPLSLNLFSPVKKSQDIANKVMETLTFQAWLICIFSSVLTNLSDRSFISVMTKIALKIILYPILICRKRASKLLSVCVCKASLKDA